MTEGERKAYLQGFIRGHARGQAEFALTDSEIEHQAVEDMFSYEKELFFEERHGRN
jgi:hypothetical protein